MIVVSTLADHHVAYDVHAVCDDCGRSARVDLVILAERFGWDIPITDLRPRLRCSANPEHRQIRFIISGAPDSSGARKKARQAEIAASRQRLAEKLVHQ